MEKVLFIMLMVTSMMVNFKMIKQMANVFIIVLMETSMMVNGKIIKEMEKVLCIMPILANKNVFTKMITKLVVNFYDWLIVFKIKIFNTI